MGQEESASDSASGVSGNPQSEEDWIFHSLNIHGEFFERSCQHTIRRSPLFTLTTTNYPVAVDGHQSELDIRADYDRPHNHVILLIECKKNNPEFVNWVFFPKASQPRSISLSAIETSGEAAFSGLYDAEIVLFHSPIVADGGRETKGNYLSYNKQKSDKTKTSNAAITEAAKQIALATLAITKEESYRAAEARTNAMQALPKRTVIIPIIVTSAQLFVCEFDPQDVNIETGEIPFAKAKLSNIQNYVIYQYPLPNHLHSDLIRAIDRRSVEKFVRRDIVVVQSAQFSNFLSSQVLQIAGV
jgi:hypothetical protein